MKENIGKKILKSSEIDIICFRLIPFCIEISNYLIYISNDKEQLMKRKEYCENSSVQ